MILRREAMGATRSERASLILAAAAVFAVVSVSSATVIRVPDDAATIAAGISSASAGDTVMIACGTYHERNMYVFVPITLTSETGDPSCVTIDGDATGWVLFIQDADGTVLSGLTIAHGLANYGAGVFANETRTTIHDCVFRENHATEEGGGLTCTRDLASISNCQFIDNVADLGGGGMVLDEESGALTDCTFTGNSAIWGGGLAAYRQATTASFVDCDFVDNRAVGEESYGAGGYCWDGAAPTFTHWTFTANVSDHCGGGFACDTDCATGFSDCTFEANDAVYGGGLYDYDSAGGGTTDCAFIENTASDGGGIYYESVDNAWLTYSLFARNVATRAGGGITLDDSSGGPTGCTLFGNTARYGGGMALRWCTDPTVSGCTIALNHIEGDSAAGAGIVAWTGTSMSIDRSIIAFNTSGPAVACTLGVVVDVTTSNVHGNEGGDWVDCLAGQESANNNTDADPRFCAMFEDDFMLCSNSPCLPEVNGVALMGARAAGCTECLAAVRETSWGAIKALFLRRE
jgi:hypothetical protein